METIMSLPVNTILEKSVWVAYMEDESSVNGNYFEIMEISKKDGCKDFSICGKQSEDFRPFFNKYFDYCDIHGFISVQDFYYEYKVNKEVIEDEIIQYANVKERSTVKDSLSFITKEDSKFILKNTNNGTYFEYHVKGMEGVDGKYLINIKDGNNWVPSGFLLIYPMKMMDSEKIRNSRIRSLKRKHEEVDGTDYHEITNLLSNF